MISGNVTIINKLGLHARATGAFVNCAKGFASAIRIGREGNLVDGKSIMSVMMLAATQGTVLQLETEGKDERAAYDAIEALINNYFGEGE